MTSAFIGLCLQGKKLTLFSSIQDRVESLVLRNKCSSVAAEDITSRFEQIFCGLKPIGGKISYKQSPGL